MRVRVIIDENGLKAPAKMVETLFAEDAMQAHGEAILRKERYDRNELSLDCLIDGVFKKPGDTVKVIENQISKVHLGIISGFSFQVTPNQVEMNYTAEVVYEQ